MTFVTKLTMADAGWPGSSSANRWQVLSFPPLCFFATKPNILGKKKSNILSKGYTIQFTFHFSQNLSFFSKIFVEKLIHVSFHLSSDKEFYLGCRSHLNDCNSILILKIWDTSPMIRLTVFLRGPFHSMWQRRQGSVFWRRAWKRVWIWLHSGLCVCDKQKYSQHTWSIL